MTGDPPKHSGPDVPVPKGITFQPDIYPKVLSILPAGKPLKVLDVGAGEGFFTLMLKQAGHEVEACDVRPDAFAVDAPFHIANLNESIPLPSESFDCVVSIEVIEHIENHPTFVSELFRVARKGGTVIITTPNILNIPSRWYFLQRGTMTAHRSPLCRSATITNCSISTRSDCLG